MIAGSFPLYKLWLQRFACFENGILFRFFFFYKERKHSRRASAGEITKIIERYGSSVLYSERFGIDSARCCCQSHLISTLIQRDACTRVHSCSPLNKH